MAAQSDSCWSCCCSFITTMGLIALFLWLSLRVDQPKFYLQSIYIPALNKSLSHSHPQNATVSFNFTVKFVNPNKDKGIKYDAVGFNFSLFLDSNSTRPLANATVGGFYQGHQKKAVKPGSAEAFSGAGNLTAALNGKVYFRVDFSTKVKYKILLWYTGRHSMWGGANVKINDSGEKAYTKPVRLGDSAARIENGAPGIGGGYRARLILRLPVLVAALLVLDGHSSLT